MHTSGALDDGLIVINSNAIKCYNICSLIELYRLIKNGINLKLYLREKLMGLGISINLDYTLLWTTQCRTLMFSSVASMDCNYYNIILNQR